MSVYTGSLPRSIRESIRRRPEPGPFEVVPFGRYGAGLWTGHPVGLFVALGVVAMALISLPEARPFLAGAIALGSVGGILLRRRHRKEAQGPRALAPRLFSR
jgi:hypothetical protein